MNLEKIPFCSDPRRYVDRLHVTTVATRLHQLEIIPTRSVVFWNASVHALLLRVHFSWSVLHPHLHARNKGKKPFIDHGLAGEIVDRFFFPLIVSQNRIVTFEYYISMNTREIWYRTSLLNAFIQWVDQQGIAVFHDGTNRDAI